MDAYFLETITDDSMAEALAKDVNVSAIEVILADHNEELLRLRGMEERGELDLGCGMKAREVKGLFTDVVNEVNELMGTSDIKAPRVWYYDPIKPTPLNLAIYGLIAYSAAVLAKTIFIPGDMSLPNATLNILIHAPLFQIGRYIHS